MNEVQVPRVHTSVLICRHRRVCMYIHTFYTSRRLHMYYNRAGAHAHGPCSGVAGEF